MRAGGADKERDQRLQNAAADVISEHGFEGLRGDVVAARAEVPEDAVPEPWELFAAVIRTDEDRFNAIVDGAVGAANAPAEQLLAVIEACVTDFDWTYWIELWSLGLRDERARELRDQLDVAFRARIANLIEAGRAAGAFDVPDPESAAVAISTLIDALAVDATLRDDTVSPNYMFGLSASVAGRLVGAELKLPGRGDDA